MRAAILALALAASLLAGCIHPLVDRDGVCRTLHESPGLIDRASPRALAEYGAGTSPEAPARRAYGEQISAWFFGATGTAALLAGFITGFATNPGTQPDARTAGWALGGSGIGLIAVALGMNYFASRAATEARVELHDWAARCR